MLGDQQNIRFRQEVLVTGYRDFQRLRDFKTRPSSLFLNNILE